MTTLTITSIDVLPMRFPFAQPIGSALGNYDWVEFVSVDLHTNEGLTGFGFTLCLGGHANSAVVPYIYNELAPLVIGQNALAPEALWHRMWAPNKARLRAGLGMWALSAIDIACWDLVAQTAGLPLHSILGGYEHNVPVYGSCGWLTLSEKELVADCIAFADKGITGYKLKVGSPQDEQRIARLREEMGPTFMLSVDANQAYLPHEAIELSHMLREYDVAWIEEPVLADSIEDLVIVAAKSAIPVAAGENVYTRWGFREICERGAAQYLQPDAGRCGGITEFRKIAHLAESFNLKLSAHLTHELSTSLVGASPSGYMVEYTELLPDNIWTVPFEVKDGRITVPDVPGHGLQLSEYAKRTYRHE